MRLACQEQLIPGTDLLAKWDFIRSAGFDGIELRGAGGLGFRERLPELRAAARAGVELPTVCVLMDHFIGDFDPGRRHDRRRQHAVPAVGDRRARRLRRRHPGRLGMFSRRLPPFTRRARPPRTGRCCWTRWGSSGGTRPPKGPGCCWSR